MERKFNFKEAPAQKPEEKDKRKAAKKEAEKVLNAARESGIVFNPEDFDEEIVPKEESEHDEE